MSARLPPPDATRPLRLRHVGADPRRATPSDPPASVPPDPWAGSGGRARAARPARADPDPGASGTLPGRLVTASRGGVRRRQRPVRGPPTGQDQLDPRHGAHQHRRRVRPAGPGCPPAPRDTASQPPSSSVQQHPRRSSPSWSVTAPTTGCHGTRSSTTFAEWLAEYNGTDQPTVASPSVIWGHSGLLRRPRDEHWERRTDAFHRTGRSVLPDLEVIPPEEALADLVLAHLGAYGPVTRADLAYFFGDHDLGRSTEPSTGSGAL